MKKILLLIIGILLLGCNPEDKPSKSSIPQVIALTFLQSDNPTLPADISADVDEATQKIDVFLGTDIGTKTLIPTLRVSDGSSSNIEELTPMRIDAVHALTVSNNGETRTYTITFHYSNESVFVTAIKINGAESYYNKSTGTFYAPLVRDLWGKTVAVEVVGKGITSSTIGTEKVAYGKTVEIGLSLNETYEIKIDGEMPLTVKLMITGLPILTLNSELPMASLTNDSKTECTVSLFDPEKQGTRNCYNLNGVVRVRGNSSSYYDKKSLALELRNKNTSETIDKAFLNMRSDDDWILDAMYMEQLRMRNRVSHDIWLDMHKPHYASKEPKALSTNRGEMAEMFYNGEYMGIYCISEKVDRKQLDLNKTTGAMYKGESWDEECILKNSMGYDVPYDDFFSGWQIQHPTEPNNWEPFLDFLQFAIESDFKGAASTFAKGITDRVVMDNMVDFLLHLNIVNGTDNTGRNTFLSVYDTNSKTGEESKFFYTPWDLDATFGTDWLYQQVDPDLFLGLQDVDVPSERTYGNFMLMKIAKYDIGGFGAKIKKRWAELRADKASERKIIERFEYYYDILNTSGAYSREYNRWGNNYQQTFYVSYDPRREMEYLKSWIPQHLRYVDSYIQNWDSNAAKIVIQR